MARLTVKSLAAAVGVSPATISNAYNHPDQLSAELRERILATAAELGYPGPDAAGRRLRIGRAEAIGVLLSERLSYAFSDPFAIEFLTGLSEVVEEHGISIVLMPLSTRVDVASTPNGADDRDLIAVRNANIDALAILSLPTDHPAAMVAKARGIRLVTTDMSSDPESSWVAIDDFGAGVMVGEHLARLGHRDVAVLVETNEPAGSPGRSLDASQLGFLDYAARLAGLQKAVAGQVMIISGGHNAIESGTTATSWLLDHDQNDLDQTPTAIVGLSDVLALGALRVLASRGLSVPADVSVCGFDDIAAAQTANLTTVHQPIRDKGQHVGRLLIDPESQPRQVLLPISLVTRETTGQA
ncbi:MAG TPA: LacI family DNA-binding transcriptional regulator, partial [Propionibacteriaceae bacterium]|nr:LacI family DNA-binding transcriptional regulator [Propionibacteriaceae bacterium]